jgi:ParB-like nuclease domain
MTAAPNPLPPLDAATEAALRESIERFGVRVPILIDQHGEIVDGRHRHRIAAELGVPCPAESTRMPDDPEERAALLAQINDARRPRLSVEDRREIVLRFASRGIRSARSRLRSARRKRSCMATLRLRWSGVTTCPKPPMGRAIPPDR